MFTVTKDLVLPTTVTGSWPRPRWFNLQLDGQPMSTRMKDVAFREQYTDAIAALLSDQERAGLDILTTGDYHHDDMVGGQGWHVYPLQRWRGLTGDYGGRTPELPTYAPGTIMKEVLSAWRWPRVESKIEANEDNPLEFARIWRLAQSRTTRPVMFGTISSQLLIVLVGIEPGSLYDGKRRDLIWDMAEVMNQELRDLAAAGCRVIQLEDPLLHPVARYDSDNTEQIDFLVDAFNREVEGLNDVEVWVHTCWGNPNMQRGTDDHSYENSIEIYLERLNADVVSFEMKDSDGSEIALLKPYKDTTRRKIGIGVVSHRTLQVESAAEVAAFTRRALENVSLENLILTSDCGFGRQGSNRLIAFYKASAIAQGANIIRQELGLEERYIPVMDSAINPDDLLDSEETKIYSGIIDK